MILPQISVIIIAHDKKEFLLDAVRSVKAQSLEREFYEIVCVKNFVDSFLDVELSKHVDVLLSSRMQGYGSKVKEAIEASRGEILCFLDYDDMFLKDKLRIIYDAFKNNKNLVYFHNGRTSRMSEVNKTVLLPAGGSGKTHFVDLKESQDREVIAFFRNYPDFNSSSISVRKNILIGKESQMESMVMHPDTFLLFSALESEGVLIDDLRVLTFYRVHQSTTNHFALSEESFFSEKVEYYGRTESDWGVIRSFLKKESSKMLCECETLHNSLIRQLYDINTRRSALFCEIIRFIRCLRSRKFLNMFLLTIISLAIFLFPRIGRYMYFASSTRLVTQS